MDDTGDLRDLACRIETLETRVRELERLLAREEARREEERLLAAGLR